MLPHAGVIRAACPDGRTCDFAKLLAATQPIVSSADVAICHLEVPIAPAGVTWSGYPLFGAPPQIADGLRATGWDRCSTASNHSLDKKSAGIDSTLNELDRVGLGHAGTARTEEESRPVVFEAKGVKIAHLSYAYGFNGLKRPANQLWRANLINADRIEADARTARAMGAEIVIVSMHWGLEYRSAPTTDQIRLAKRLTQAGDIDLIVGHHAHVLQPVGRFNDRWVIFGMGNHLSSQQFQKRPSSTEDGVIFTVNFHADGPRFVAEKPKAFATYMSPTKRVVVIDSVLGAPAGQPSAAAIQSKRRTASVIGDYLVF